MSIMTVACACSSAKRTSSSAFPRDTGGWFVALLAGALLLAASAVGRAGPLALAPEDQKKVDWAIDRGVQFLKKTQMADGSWGNHRGKARIGYAALPGLTLLECGVPKTSPLVRRAAGAVRRAAPTLNTTYELALSILFLDRLGNPHDEKIIQTLAVRLIAGQTATGGWNYNCPIVNTKNHKEILVLLRRLNPPPDPPPAPGKRPGLDGFPVGKKKPGDAPSGGITEPKKKSPKGYTTSKSSPGDDPTGKITIPRHLRSLPVFQDPETLLLPGAAGARILVPAPGRGPRRRFFLLSDSDNSNTQFAILGLWVAQRHGVPMQRTTALIVKRFETSQNPDGSWKYRYTYGGNDGWGTPAMTGVGLLGLAVGHGLAHDGMAVKEPVKDQRLLNGLVALSRTLGEPTGKWKDLPIESLYFLWSVERVGVLFDLPTIGGKDWYRWGAEQLIANQSVLGGWQGGEYPGSSVPIDTCFALLFLKRSNLVSDLTARLPFKPKELAKYVTLQAGITPKPSMKTPQSPGEAGSFDSPFEGKKTDKKEKKKR